MALNDSIEDVATEGFDVSTSHCSGILCTVHRRSGARRFGSRALAVCPGPLVGPERARAAVSTYSTQRQVAVDLVHVRREPADPLGTRPAAPSASLGTQAWPLLKHRWSNGRQGKSRRGRVAASDLRHAESAESGLGYRRQAGDMAIQPLSSPASSTRSITAGIGSIRAITAGASRSSSKATFSAACLFTYDTFRQPTWVMGFERGRNQRRVHSLMAPARRAPIDRRFKQRRAHGVRVPRRNRDHRAQQFEPCRWPPA